MDLILSHAGLNARYRAIKIAFSGSRGLKPAKRRNVGMKADVAGLKARSTRPIRLTDSLRGPEGETMTLRNFAGSRGVYRR